ncbi:transporter substrate-binding domain-containing protein [Oceanobacillus neutriphilus]|uniref:Amino acid ABC transporter substrate-binding protein n=1 Tax=Oceanobacillus neutriphilus TaxID=531815 RepID=A0ABQ2P0V3_9BACI|nr:transporter substrate-binding domain-containing protein [Oceanobacillus neutriphilus]GGP15290.1 amino acid ABC transporter substrate-binding protein [Oceanobacillus neutriphilus]
MKKLLLFISAAFLLLTAACGQGEAKGEGDSDSSEEKVIKVGAVPDGFPHTFQEDGELVGFNVDIFNAIFDDIGYEVEWVLTEWDGVLANLQSGKVDTAINFAATPERGEAYDFTDPYYRSKAVVATSSEDPQIESLDDLAGKELVSILGTNFENVLKENYPEEDYELVIYESADVAYTDINTGKVDGFIYGREPLMAQISQRNIPLKIVDKPFGNQPVALPFQKTEENQELIAEINQSIEKLKEDGTFSEISLKWFDVDFLAEEQ